MEALRRHPIRYVLLLLSLIVISLLFVSRLEISNPPSAEKVFTITTHYYGVDAEEIQKVITIPLENAVSIVPGIKMLKSISETNTSRIFVTLHPTTEAQDFYLDLREQVDLVSSRFPRAVQRPQIYYSDTTREPVFIVSFYSPTLPLPSLAEHLKENLVPELQKLSGIGEIIIGGEAVEEVRISTSPDRMSAYGISISQLVRNLQKAYLRQPLGELLTRTSQIPVFFDSSFTSLEDILDFPLFYERDALIRVKDLASVEKGYREPERVSRINGKKRVVLYIHASSEANILLLSKNIRNFINSYEELNPLVVYDQGARVEEEVKRLFTAVMISIGSLVVLMFLFTRSPRLTVSLSLPLPLTLLVAFALFSLLGITVHAYLLSSLALGVGLIIDTSFVIFEYRRRNPHDPLTPLIPPVIASSLTTLITLLPLWYLRYEYVWIESLIMGFMFLFSLSFIVHFFFLDPPLSQALIRVRNVRPLLPLTPLRKFFLSLAHKAYPETRVRRGLMWGGYACISILSLLLLLFLPKEITPPHLRDTYFLRVEYPPGTTIEAVDRFIQPYLGYLSQQPGILLVESRAERASAQISLRFEPSRISPGELKILTEKGESLLGKGRVFTEESGEATGITLEYVLTGDDYETLKRHVSRIAERLSAQSWVSEVVLHFKDPPPSLILKPSMTSSLYMVAPDEMGNTLRWLIQRPVALKWLFNGKELDLRVGMAPESLSPQDLSSLPLPAPSQNTYTVHQLFSTTSSTLPSRYYRYNRQNALAFSFRVPPMSLERLSTLLKGFFSSLELPPGYGLHPDPLIGSSQKSYSLLLLLLILASFLILAVLIIQSNSVVQPLFVLSIIPPSLLFPLLGLLLARRSLSFPILLGLILLSGICVNNFILIFERFLFFQKRYADQYKALLLSLNHRFESLFLSTATSMIGALPMFWTRNPFSTSLAYTLFIGLAGAFFFTFWFVPLFLPSLTSRKSPEALSDIAQEDRV